MVGSLIWLFPYGITRLGWEFCGKAHSLRNVGYILHESSINICHETVRCWWNTLPMTGCWSRRQSTRSLCNQAPWPQCGLENPQKIMKRYGRPHVIVANRLRSYGAAMKVIGDQAVQEVGQWKTINVKIPTYHFEGENTSCYDFGLCEFCRNSFQSILLFSTILKNTAF